MSPLPAPDPTFACWGSLPPPVHGTSLMNVLTSKALGGLGQVVWVDPSNVMSPRDIGRSEWRQLAAGIRALARFSRALNAPGGSRGYLAVSVDGKAFWRDVGAWALASMRTALPPIVHLHTGATAALTQGVLKRPVASWLLRRSEIWLLSERFRDGLPVDSMAFVVPNGLDCSGSQHGKIVATDCAPEEEPIHLLFLSNRLRAKGVLSAINVSSHLLAQHGERLRVTFAGPPMDSLVEEALTKLQQTHPSGVSILDGVESESKCQLLGHADVLIFPSRYRLEGAPLVLIEGLMHGVYCIVTDHAALPDIVGNSGSVVEDEVGMIDAYNAFAELSREAREGIKMAAIERWREHYSADTYCSRVADLVQAASQRCVN